MSHTMPTRPRVSFALARRGFRSLLVGALAVSAGAATLAAVPGTAAAATNPSFAKGSFERPGDGTVVLPLQRGTSPDGPVFYVITDASDTSGNVLPDVNRSRKLANAAGTAAVQQVTVNPDGTLDFAATVDFSPVRSVVPGPQGAPFPPAVAQPGAIARAGYSPLIQLPDGRIVNAPHVANDSGDADKLVSVDEAAGVVTYRLTKGFVGGDATEYISTEASAPDVAALEAATYAPALAAAPGLGDDDTRTSARAPLVAFINGRTGATNPQRQGINSALVDGLDPLNILGSTPRMSRYSPLWDVHIAEWTPRAFASNQVVQRRDVGRVEGDVGQGLISGPGGAAFGPIGVVVNCPIIFVR